MNMTSLWNTSGNKMTDVTTRKSRHEAEVANTEIPWDNSQPDKQACGANGEPFSHRIFSEAETHRDYSEAEDAYGKQDYEAANVEGGPDDQPLTRRNHSEAEPHTRRIFSQAETHRNYSESEDAYGKQAYEAANVEGGADVEKIVTRAAAGIGTNTENYGNTRTQRRQYSEATADEVIDVTEEIEAPTEEEEEEIKKKEEAARVKKAEEKETKETEKEAARVEKKKVEECEGVLSQRRHFPGSTTSNIFN